MADESVTTKPEQLLRPLRNDVGTTVLTRRVQGQDCGARGYPRDLRQVRGPDAEGVPAEQEDESSDRGQGRLYGCRKK